MTGKETETVLEGTTRKVFRYIYRQGKPVGIRDVQRALNMSSPSVASYHATKLLNAGLIREEEGGFTVDRVVFENMVRVGRTAFPIQSAFATFFLASLALLLTVLRPTQLSSEYVFSVVVAAVASGVSLTGAFKAVMSP